MKKLTFSKLASAVGKLLRESSASRSGNWKRPSSKNASGSMPSGASSPTREIKVFDLTQIRTGIAEVRAHGGQPTKITLPPEIFEAFKVYCQEVKRYPSTVRRSELFGLRVAEDPRLPPDVVIIS
ncbi:MAG TPA: hypothetical protein VD994_18040 [Prosthecobacter sp.]|nr:hypothetical protein [Prosthecobacter sp.]